MTNQMADIRRITEEGYELLIVRGEIDASSSIDLDHAVAACVQSGLKKIIVNLNELNYISSAGLGVFMSYVEELREKNIRLVLFGLNQRVSHTFGLLGLSELLDVVITKEEAIIKIHEA